MSKYLPLKDFVWSDNDLTEQDILNLSDESDVGYILEVDLEYPSDLHDKHSDFFPLPLKISPHLILSRRKQLNSATGTNNSTRQQERTLGSRNETTPLGNMNETTQLVSRNETTQLCTAVDRLQPPATAYNRLQPPTTACNRL
ncbi:hypothetical protein TNCV_2031931 [Trichonephila clavipes]|nr:hypothetical protein TNCV_2031931 [Trichonephila clavipes]